ncbi:glycosyltransferase family 4 protein [Roseobacter weihaiensis]|uniref:glycosyltransferase family 4 protein n=1 Tax=Roseobacter weihaiensis TaxID=2763262 RepID=UPI001D0AC95C|nr:glycosyltransferase family 4 protein [Roseobacter sp. H9]
MIRAAFYAPMKPPTHPVPSGDRTMAQAILQALSLGGIDTDLASELQTRDGAGDAQVQAARHEKAAREVARLIPAGQAAGWRVWITYHNYYKAPDLIGPVVADALKIPYLLVEATRARKRLQGPWAGYAQAAEAATDAAAIVFYLTSHDSAALQAYGAASQRLVHLRPFLPRKDLPPTPTTKRKGLLSVGMQRHGDKLASYRLIADSLAALKTEGWTLNIAGDGPAHAEVKTMMAPFGKQVAFLGALRPTEMQRAYKDAALLLWPGVNEAFGMTYLEAQAQGLPVVAQDRPGVRDVLAPGAAYPDPSLGAPALAARLDFLLANPKLIAHLGAEARQHIARHHLLGPAAETLKQTIIEVLQ